MLASLSHPNILTIWDAQHWELSKRQDILVLVTEFMSGGDLSRYMTRALQEQHALPLLMQVASAMSAAHQVAIVHRDIKPENVLVTGDPTKGDVNIKLADFGIAGKSTGRLHGIAGSCHYMAPEVWLGCSTFQSDVYAWGVMAYYLLTNVHPFGGYAIGDMAKAHMRHQPAPVSQIVAVHFMRPYHNLPPRP